MVDSVKSAISRIETAKTQPCGLAESLHVRHLHNLQRQPDSDSVQLKSAEIAVAAKEMASVAPVNMENVNRIKAAIKEGKYPIDIDRISDALMDAYRDLKS